MKAYYKLIKFIKMILKTSQTSAYICCDTLNAIIPFFNIITSVNVNNNKKGFVNFYFFIPIIVIFISILRALLKFVCIKNWSCICIIKLMVSNSAILKHFSWSFYWAYTEQSWFYSLIHRFSKNLRRPIALLIILWFFFCFVCCYFFGFLCCWFVPLLEVSFKIFNWVFFIDAVDLQSSQFNWFPHRIFKHAQNNTGHAFSDIDLQIKYNSRQKKEVNMICSTHLHTSLSIIQ